MSIRPLDLAQSIQNQAQQAQQRLGEQAAERGQVMAQQEADRREAVKQLAQVQKQREIEGLVVRDESGTSQDPGEGQHGATGESTEQHPEHPHPPHADETLEGKGRAVDIDV